MKKTKSYLLPMMIVALVVPMMFLLTGCFGGGGDDDEDVELLPVHALGTWRHAQTANPFATYWIIIQANESDAEGSSGTFTYLRTHGGTTTIVDEANWIRSGTGQGIFLVDAANISMGVQNHTPDTLTLTWTTGGGFMPNSRLFTRTTDTPPQVS